LHERHKVTRSEVIDGQPNDHDNKPDNQDINSEQLPEKASSH
jgi:hypothetical protein